MSSSDRPTLLDEQASHDTQSSDVGASTQAAGADPHIDVRGWIFAFAQRTFLLLGFYVLSIGPMYWHWYGGRFAQGSLMVAAFYEPLFRLASWVPWFGEWMDWYVGLWI